MTEIMYVKLNREHALSHIERALKAERADHLWSLYVAIYDLIAAKLEAGECVMRNARRRVTASDLRRTTVTEDYHYDECSSEKLTDAAVDMAAFFADHATVHVSRSVETNGRPIWLLDIYEFPYGPCVGFRGRDARERADAMRVAILMLISTLKRR